MKFTLGDWVHVAFTYDGEGTGRFFVNGRYWGGQQFAGRGAIVAGGAPLSIGDRLGGSAAASGRSRRGARRLRIPRGSSTRSGFAAARASSKKFLFPASPNGAVSCAWRKTRRSPSAWPIFSRPR